MASIKKLENFQQKIIDVDIQAMTESVKSFLSLEVPYRHLDSHDELDIVEAMETALGAMVACIHEALFNGFSSFDRWKKDKKLKATPLFETLRSKINEITARTWFLWIADQIALFLFY